MRRGAVQARDVDPLVVDVGRDRATQRDLLWLEVVKLGPCQVSPIEGHVLEHGAAVDGSLDHRGPGCVHLLEDAAQDVDVVELRVVEGDAPERAVQQLAVAEVNLAEVGVLHDQTFVDLLRMLGPLTLGVERGHRSDTATPKHSNSFLQCQHGLLPPIGESISPASNQLL